MDRPSSVHPTVQIGKDVRMGAGVTIEQQVVIGDHVQIGAGCRIGSFTLMRDQVALGAGSMIGSHCILGELTTEGYRDPVHYQPRPTFVGEGSLIRSHTVIYAGARLGPGFESGHHVAIREETVIGDHCRVGSFCDLQGHLTVGRYGRFHSNVHVGQGSQIGSFVWLFPYVILTNDPLPPSTQIFGCVVDDYAVIATRAILLPGVRIGSHAFVGAEAVVRDEVPAGQCATGNPARVIGPAALLRNKLTGKRNFPWPRFFDRGMPWEGVGYDVWCAQQHAKGKADGR